jgi:hypothetical protein
MTREEQVGALLEVLPKPPPDRRDAIENALAWMAMASSSHRKREAESSKAYSKALRAYDSAARRMRARINALLNAGGGVPIGGISLEQIEDSISWSEPQRVRPRGSIKPTWAVALAYELCTELGASVGLTHRGDWWRVAAILYGRLPPIDLFRHMRKFKPEFSPFRRR